MFIASVASVQSRAQGTKGAKDYLKYLFFFTFLHIYGAVRSKAFMSLAEVVSIKLISPLMAS